MPTPGRHRSHVGPPTHPESCATFRVERLLRSALRAGYAPSAVAAWSIGRQPPVSVAVGAESVRGDGQPVGPSSWYDLASLTKPLAAGSLFLVAMARGALALETRLDHCLPEARGTPIGSCTLRHLLTHTSGLPAWAPVYALAAGRRERTLPALLGIPLESAVGERVRYSCLGFLLLGPVLERALDMPLGDAFELHVSGPSGLTAEIGYLPDTRRVRVAAGAVTSRVEETLTRDAGLDSGFLPERGSHLPDDGNARFLGGVAANAGLFGTAAGVVKLARRYLGGDRPFEPSMVGAAVRSWTPGLEQERGLAWQLAGTLGCSAGHWLSSSAFGHSGFTGTSVWVDPDQELTVALLTNRLHPGARQLDLHPLRRSLHRLLVASDAPAEFTSSTW